MNDALHPRLDEVLAAWAARVRANREQVDQFREASPTDFYAPVAGMFRADPRRQNEPMLDKLRELMRPADTVLDIGAGGGRYALPLALVTRKVVAIEPSEGMRRVLGESTKEFGIDNVETLDGRWPAIASEAAVRGDVALMSQIGYDVEDIGPFVDAMERAAPRVCIAVLLSQPPPTEADRLWPAVHGVERATLPALPEFLTLLLARNRLFELTLLERPPQTYADPEQLLPFLRQQLWTRPGSDKDKALEKAARERLIEHDGRFALSLEPVYVGVVSWTGSREAPRAS